MTIRDLARRADIALRTLAARRIAADASAWARRHSPAATTNTFIASLRIRASWAHVGGQEVACTFGSRRRIIRIPITNDVQQVASMIARTEIRVLLGDAPAPLITHLQAFAESELQRCFSNS